MRIAGDWPLTEALKHQARSRGLAVESGPARATAAPTISVVRHGEVVRSAALPGPLDVAQLVAEHLLRHFLTGFTVPPDGITGVLHAPAAGMTGPATSGPVNAIHIGPDLTPHVPVPTSLRLLRAQQTRLWLLVADCAVQAGTDWLPSGPGIAVTPAAVAADTARAAEYLEDAALGSRWPGVLMLARPDWAGPGRLRAVLAGTEAGALNHLIQGVLA
jgi:hypothetical protein